MEPANKNHLDSNTSDFSQDDAPLDIAIIGGGIVGVILALGLLSRGMKVRIFERADDFHEVGAGLAFTGIARQCLQQLDPRSLAAFCRVGDENRHPQNRYWDGYNPKSKQDAQGEDSLLFQTSTRDMAYWGCLRSALLDELAKELAPGVVHFGKELSTYIDEKGERKVKLRFTDGSSTEADLVIGCDGIKSRTRKLLFGDNEPVSHASYTHQVAYRAVVPIAGGVAALGEDKANNQCMHMGPNAHVLTYPIANWTLLNVVIFVADPNPWSSASHTTANGHRSDVQHILREWSPAVRELVDLLPEQINQWAIFDMAEHPAPFYAKGRVCIAGDAAHASSPHHGAGAGAGVEDALALAAALEAASFTIKDRFKDGRPGLTGHFEEYIVAALEAYSSIRYDRTQWLVRSSRETGTIYQWAYEDTGREADKCKKQVEERTKVIWDFDIENMVKEVVAEYERRSCVP